MLLACQTVAQAPNIRFSFLSIEDGLSQTTVTAAVQDASGFMWFGTQDGLNRYDGYEFVHLKHDPNDPTTLRNDSIFTLYADADDTLWVGTEGGGLSRWDSNAESFVHYTEAGGAPAGFDRERVRVISRDGSGALWIGTHASGVFRLDEASGRWDHFASDPSDAKSLSDNRVRAIVEDRTGRLWIGTRDGLNLFDRAAGNFTRFRTDPQNPASISSNIVRALLEDSRGNLWIGTLGGGLNRMDRSTGTFERFTHDENNSSSLSENRVRVIFEDDAGRLWVGTERGINLLQEDGTFVRYGHNPLEPTSLSGDRVTTITQDRNGMIWVGVFGKGLDRWHPLDWNFGHFRGGESGLSNDLVHAFTEDGNGTLYVGTMGGGLNVINRSTGTVHTMRHDPQDPASLSSDRITALLTDSRKALWVGTLSGGLSRLSPDGAGFEHFRADDNTPGSLSSDAIMTVFEDRSGVIWVGTYGGGLNRFDRNTGRFTHFTYADDDPGSLSGNNVSTIVEDPSGALWVGTLGDGLNLFDPVSGQSRHFRNDESRDTSLSSDEVLSFHLDPSGVLWIGTQGGGLNRLERFEGEAGEAVFQRYTEHDGLPNDVIYGILPDARGGLWLSTIRGLARLDPVSGAIEAFDVTDGLQADEFNLGAYYRGHSGELFFGGVNGFNAFFPDRIERNTAVPNLALTSFLKLNEPARVGQPIHRLDRVDLDWRDYVVSFEFAALDFRSPKHNRYAYKLEGLDSDWIELGTRNQITFTNLEPGPYTLLVRGANSDGVWNEAGLSLPISVAAPPWKQWWAYLVYALIALALIVRFVLDRRAEKRTRETLREAAEAAQAANEAKSQFLTNISHEIRTPMNGVLGMATLLRNTDLDANQREKLDIISKSGDAMLEVINQILDFSQMEAHRTDVISESFDLRTCIEDALDVVAPIAAKKGLDLGYSMSENTPEMVIGDRMRTRQVLINLVANAVKFTEEGDVEVRVETSKRQQNMQEIWFEVEDTGPGIAPDKLERLFKPFSQVDGSSTRRYEGTGLGLAISKHLVEMMGGRIWVKSTVGKGSTFHFTILAGRVAGLDRGFLSNPHPDLAGKDLLIINRPSSVLKHLRQQAARWGMRVQLADSASKAMEKLWAGTHFDLVLVDSQGLLGRGASWLDDLQKICKSKDLPIISLYPNSMDGQRVKEDLGAVAAVSKPIHPEMLLKTLSSVLVSKAIDPSAIELDEPADHQATPARNLNILVVDDNFINRRVAMLVLQNLGYKATAVESGSEALEALRNTRYDVVFMDVQMPEMDGYEASRAIWQEFQDEARPWIIAMTAHNLPGDREKCLAAGMHDYIAKPIDIQHLRSVLDAVPDDRRIIPSASNLPA
jgi:signal transduction histidine kinase/ligand-binding sensor domain-containing protein/CheY-like chemotaxis protein